jgi:DNA-directed RNA polymerase specialized sigma24 family protein
MRSHAAPRAWVVRTALNLGVSWWRRRHREVPLADHDAEMLADPGPADPGDGVDPALMTALRRLPGRQRDVPGA